MAELVEKNNIQRGNFRISGFKELERMLHSNVENCQLLAIPYIMSKVRYFKDKFSALLELKEASGFGWDDVRGCVVADDTVFAGWVKCWLMLMFFCNVESSKASGLNNKPLPYWDELCRIFGVDQALGADAVQPADAASKLEGEGRIYDLTDEYSHYDSFSIPQSFDHNDVIEEIINQGIDLHATSLKEVEEISSRKMQPKGKGKEKATSSGSKRSRQTFSEEDHMHISENIALTAENITNIATNYCIEGDLAVKRQYLYGELSKFMSYLCWSVHAFFVT
ncbi:hypothetical protein LINPERPRIM_LOCUS33372 [Linum perenne]